ncbi:unnamed protein product [Rodentolepis nana]|uniref:SSD domain-containing protein n=1 Tax=Rodentolepis nana TaxID=102285 RepID=A0A0R3TU16_RODNA|nr:unnamed protein product [Rodentolepis nana]
MSKSQQDIEIGLPEHSDYHHVSLSCCSSLQLWWYYKFASFENFLHGHHWKVFSVLLLLLLLCLGLKFARPETNFYRLWVGESSRLSSELDYLAQELRSFYIQQQVPSFVNIQYHQYPSPTWGDPYYRSPYSHPSVNPQSSTNSPLGGLPGSEFMGSIESILQVSDSNLLTIDALRDHMELLLKVHSIEVKVGAAKWRLEDLCQRAELPRAAGLHSFESLLAQLIPCVVITPLDCFWEGSKVLAPDAVVSIPWLNNQFTLKWPSLDPHHLLSSFRAQYGNQSSELTYLDEVSDMLDRTGLRHGYLTRPCLDPRDRGCPKLAPNYKSQSPDIASVVAQGCPSFAANILHWPRDLLLGGQKCSYSRHRSVEECGRSKDRSNQRLVNATALQTLLLLRSPQELYRTVRFNDPYNHESFTLLDAQNALDQWRNELKHYLIVHNKAMAQNRGWKFYGFTDNSLRDLLTQSTVRVWFTQLVGAIILVLLYGMVCLLCWREPSRSQCWLALAGLGLIVLSLIAGLGICSLIGLPFNVLSVQVLPFIILGLGMGDLFVFTTCNTCILSRSAEASQKNALWTTHVLAEHGAAFTFSFLAMVATFFSTIYIPVPVMRQFCIQAGILVLVQAVTIMTLFPVLLKLDSKRRARNRMDVLCCLRQSVATATTAISDVTNQQDMASSSSSPSSYYLPSSVSSNDEVVRVVETTSTKVRLSENAVATVKVSVSTQKQPSTALIHSIQPHGALVATSSSTPSSVPSECLCSSCQHDKEEKGGGSLLVHLASRLASILSRFLSIRVIVCLIGSALVISTVVLAPLRLRVGLNILSLIPTDAIEHGFVEKSSDAFGLIHFQLIARGSDPPILMDEHGRFKADKPRDSVLYGPGVDFARSQKQLRALFNEINDLPGVSYTGQKIWLDSFRDWLLGIQEAFDSDVKKGYISKQGSWMVNASDDGLLGLLLIVQTDSGIDLGRIGTGRLVRDEIIDYSAFRVYLHAWRVLDVFNYTSPPCTIIPDPGLLPGRITPLQREGGPNDLYIIQPASPIQLVQTSFFARGYGDVTDQIEFVKKVRSLTEQSIARGVPVFPTGLPFTLAEHYLTFWHHFCIASGILVGTVLVAGLIFLPRPIAALFAVCIGGGGSVCACLLGFLALGLDLNAISGGMILIAFGLGTKLSSGVLCGWYGPQHNIHRWCPSKSKTPNCDFGGKEDDNINQQHTSAPLRVKKLQAVLQNHTSQIFHSNVSFVLAVALLAAVRVDFIANHFFRLIGIIALGCLFDSLILLPTVCFVLEPIFPSNLYTLSSPQPPPRPSVQVVETTTISTGGGDSQEIEGVNMTDSSPFINEIEDEEDLTMHQFCDSLRRSSSSVLPRRKYASPSAGANLFASAPRDDSQHASLSTISEESSNSSSTLSLNPPPATQLPSNPPTLSSKSHYHHHHFHHNSSISNSVTATTAVRMKEFLPLLNAAMAVAQRQQSRRNAGSEPPPPPYSEQPPPPASR